MQDENYKHVIIGNIGNVVNQLIITAETNLNSYLNELINFTKQFGTRIVI